MRSGQHGRVRVILLSIMLPGKKYLSDPVVKRNVDINEIICVGLVTERLLVSSVNLL